MAEIISREVNIAWLAGLLEGEGCFLARFYNSERRRGRQFFVRIHITNNDVFIIKKASSILSELGVGYYYQLLKRKNDKHNDTLVLVVQGKGRVRKLLRYIMPYLSGKLNQAKLLNWCIQRREEMSHCYNRGTFIDSDIILNLLVRKLKEAKHVFSVNPSETTRRANYPLSW